MAKSNQKKSTKKASNEQSKFVTSLTFIFTILSIVFAVAAYMRYYS